MIFEQNKRGKIILAFSLPLLFFIIISSYTGLYTQGFYLKETLNWRMQSIGQDFINLFLIAPFLFIISLLAYTRNKWGTVLWGGAVLYLLYTFIIYCFDVHFNKLFVFYCIILGLSFYAFIYFLYSQIKEPIIHSVNHSGVIKITAIYFLVVSISFYFLWLKEIVPAVVNGSIPKTLVDAGLFTNGVQVIDLSVFLPGIFITGILLLRKNAVGFILAPMLLIFFILMDITIGFLIAIMKLKGLEGEWSISMMMALLGLLSLIILVRYFKNVKYN